MGRKRDWYRKKRNWNKKFAGFVGLVGLIVVFLLVGRFYWQLQKPDAEIWSWSIGNHVVLIDAGHGGVDPGAVGQNSLEKDITLAVSKRLKVLVHEAGGNPVMVREKDVDLGTAQGLLKRKREDLAQRIQLANDSHADVYLSIHANSYPNKSLHGPQVFYNPASQEGKLLAEMIQVELNNVAGTKRVAKANEEIYILKKANQAAIIVEIGFVSNLEEEAKLMQSDYQEQLAAAIYQGLSNYFIQLQSRTN